MKHQQYGNHKGAQWALCLSVSQIVAGRAGECGCGEPAVMLIATGADFEDEPHCALHGHQMISAAAHTLERLYPVQPAKVAA